MKTALRHDSKQFHSGHCVHCVQHQRISLPLKQQGPQPSYPPRGGGGWIHFPFWLRPPAMLLLSRQAGPSLARRANFPCRSARKLSLSANHSVVPRARAPSPPGTADLLIFRSSSQCGPARARTVVWRNGTSVGIGHRARGLEEENTCGNRALPARPPSLREIEHL